MMAGALPTLILIANLRDHPRFLADVSDRIWRAFWEPYGSSRADLDSALGEVLAAQGFPFTLVAHRGDQFAGTVTAIQSDIAARPHLGPCIAALWVEPEARGQGVARQLVATALQRLAELGHRQAYLPAKPHLRDFYTRGGWTLMEQQVGDDHLDVFARALP
jgi:predicted N-acetyltransferase YhbS